VFLTANTGAVNVSQGIYAPSGAGGGSGTVGAVGASGSGGGGGGSFGGGGGGGGSSVSIAGVGVGGGGGGGGLWGGGGGGDGTSSTSAAGGSGAGAGLAGQGSADSLPTTLGAQFSGGSGQSNPLSGGAQGAGGVGGNNGGNVLDGTSFSAVAIAASTGIGTAAAPLSVLAPSVNLSALNGSIFVTSGSTTTFQGLQTATTGTVSLSTLGGLTLYGSVNAATVNLSTLAQSNGALNLYGVINASSSVTLSSSGSGAITESSYGIYTPTLKASSVSGNIQLEPSYANKISSFQFSTAGTLVELASATFFL
jgi:hypothetical protein